MRQTSFRISVGLWARREAQDHEAGRYCTTKREMRTSGVAPTRNKRILDMWMACHTQEEIAEREGCDKGTVNNVLEDLLKNGNSADFQQSDHAQHKIDFQIPLYNIWKQQEKTQGSSHFGNVASPRARDMEQSLSSSGLFLSCLPARAGYGFSKTVLENQNAKGLLHARAYGNHSL